MKERALRGIGIGKSMLWNLQRCVALSQTRTRGVGYVRAMLRRFDFLTLGLGLLSKRLDCIFELSIEGHWTRRMDEST